MLKLESDYENQYFIKTEFLLFVNGISRYIAIQTRILIPKRLRNMHYLSETEGKLCLTENIYIYIFVVNITVPDICVNFRGF